MIYYPLALAGTAALILQVVSLVFWSRFWPFFLAIFVHLIAALAQFLRLVLLPPHAEAK